MSHHLLSSRTFNISTEEGVGEGIKSFKIDVLQLKLVIKLINLHDGEHYLTRKLKISPLN